VLVELQQRSGGEGAAAVLGHLRVGEMSCHVVRLPILKVIHQGYY
jgi:hypothetical protein